MEHSIPEGADRPAKTSRTYWLASPGPQQSWLLCIPKELLRIILIYAWSWTHHLQLNSVCRRFHELIMKVDFFAEVSPPTQRFPGYDYMTLVAAAGKTVSQDVFKATLGCFESFRPSFKAAIQNKKIVVEKPFIDNPTKEWLHAQLICHSECINGELHGMHRSLRFSTMKDRNARLTLARTLLSTEPSVWIFGRNFIRIEPPSVATPEHIAMAAIAINALFRGNPNQFSADPRLADYLPLVWEKVRLTLLQNLAKSPKGKLFDAIISLILSDPEAAKNSRAEHVRVFLGHMSKISPETLHLHYREFERFVSEIDAMELEAVMGDYRGLILSAIKPATYHLCEPILLRHEGTLDITRALSSKRTKHVFYFIASNLKRPKFSVTYSSRLAYDNSAGNGTVERCLVRVYTARCLIHTLIHHPDQKGFWAPLYQAYISEVIELTSKGCARYHRPCQYSKHKPLHEVEMKPLSSVDEREKLLTEMIPFIKAPTVEDVAIYLKTCNPCVQRMLEIIKLAQ